MPRGGGHFGGHHHGGGGHHHHGGGGWGHHHRHYRPYRGGVVFTGWWYPGYYGGRRAYVGYGIWWIIFFIIILAIILTASLATVNNNDNDSDNEGFDTEYAPLESRLIDVSQTFCSGIEMKNPSGQMPATAYVLTRAPSLTREHNYVIDDTVSVGPNSYQFWNYYLHRGSFMNASICVQSGQGVEFYIIRGSKDFQDWQDGYDKFVKFVDVGLSCPQSVAVSFHVDGTDDYFFAYAPRSSGSVRFRTTMRFYRKEYEVVQQNVKDSCSAGGVYSGKCTVSVPYSGKYYFLFATGNTTSSDGDEDAASVSWSCRGRVWVYLLAFFLPALFVITIITVICVVCCMRQRRRNSSYGNLGDDAATAAAITNTTTVVNTTTTPSEPLRDAPPPYNPATVPQPGYYGVPPAAPYSQLPYPVAAPYPPPAMPQPPPTYGATESKPL